MTNNSYIDQIAFDGMRKHLARDFTKLYIIDLGGNVRHNPNLSGTTHNVFGIQVGVAISLLVKQEIEFPSQVGEILFTEMGVDWKKERKYSQLKEWTLASIPWKPLRQTARLQWSVPNTATDSYADFVPLGNKLTKQRTDQEVIFLNFSLGTASSRDAYNYNENSAVLRRNIKAAIKA